MMVNLDLVQAELTQLRDSHNVALARITQLEAEVAAHRTASRGAPPPPKGGGAPATGLAIPPPRVGGPLGRVEASRLVPPALRDLVGAEPAAEPAPKSPPPRRIPLPIRGPFWVCVHPRTDHPVGFAGIYKVYQTFARQVVTAESLADHNSSGHRYTSKLAWAEGAWGHRAMTRDEAIALWHSHLAATPDYYDH